MENEKKKSIPAIIFDHASTTFTLAIIAMTITAWLGGDTIGLNTGIFALGGAGLPVQGIVQVFAFSIINGILSTLFLEEILLKKVMLLWRIAILFTLNLAAAIVFVIVFEWFPREEWLAWIGFFGVFTGGFGVGFFGGLIKTKMDDRRYERLLRKYKKESGV